MLHRTYLVRMPSQGTLLDIVVEGPVGSPSAPVGVGAGFTAPPPGWIGGDGVYFEWRGRPLRLPVRFGSNGFVPRLRLGWRLSIQLLSAIEEPRVTMSQTLIGTLLAPFAAFTLADPAYGPVIRLANPNEEASVFFVHFGVSEDKDGDREPHGI
jgi:hypothetical protein